MDSPKPACCELVQETNENTQQNGKKAPQDEHRWLDPRLIEHLPINIKKGKDGHWRQADVGNEQYR